MRFGVTLPVRLGAGRSVLLGCGGSWHVLVYCTWCSVSRLFVVCFLKFRGVLFRNAHPAMRYGLRGAMCFAFVCAISMSSLVSSRN